MDRLNLIGAPKNGEHSPKNQIVWVVFWVVYGYSAGQSIPDFNLSSMFIAVLTKAYNNSLYTASEFQLTSS
jgi:hypothetical protein